MIVFSELRAKLIGTVSHLIRRLLGCAPELLKAVFHVAVSFPRGRWIDSRPPKLARRYGAGMPGHPFTGP